MQRMPLSSTRISVIGAFAAIYGIWGSTYLALAVALQSLPPFLLMAVRCLAGGAILYGYARLRGSTRPPASIALLASVCGILFFAGCHGVLAEAQQRVPSGLAAVLLATIPLWIALLQVRSEEHTSELQSRQYLVCRLLLDKKKHFSQSPWR